MAKNKQNRKLLKKQQAVKKAEKLKRKEAIKMLRPLLYSFILWGLMMAVVYLPFIHPKIMDFFINFVHNSTVFLGSAIFLPVESSGSPFINVAGFNMQIIFECTAYNFYLFSFSLVLFARWGRKDKVLNFLIFVISIFILNMFRFIVMGYVGSFWPDLFYQIHDYVWTVLFGLMMFILYIWRNDKSLKHA